MKEEPHLPQSPVRLLMVVDSLQVGGGEQQVAGIAASLHRKGYRVTVACSTDGMLSDALTGQGVPVRILMPHLVKRRVSLSYARKLRLLLREGQFDLVHAHVYASAAASALATLGTSVPLVVTQHSEGTWSGRVARLVSRWTFRRAQRVIAVSQGIRNLLVTEYGVSPERVTVIPNAVTPVDDEVKMPLDRSEGPTVGMVARLQPEKGVRVFLEAVPSILASVPACRFVIVGDGPLRAELEGRARELGVQDRVCFLGFQANARALVGKLDLLALPSLSEGTPLVVLEAMAAGVPVVASRVGGIPEQVRDGQEGLLVPPGDPAALSKACIELLRDPVRAREMGEAGRRLASSHFGYEAMVGRIETVYRLVLDAAAGRETVRRTGLATD